MFSHTRTQKINMGGDGCDKWLDAGNPVTMCICIKPWRYTWNILQFHLPIIPIKLGGRGKGRIKNWKQNKTKKQPPKNKMGEERPQPDPKAPEAAVDPQEWLASFSWPRAWFNTQLNCHHLDILTYFSWGAPPFTLHGALQIIEPWQCHFTLLTKYQPPICSHLVHVKAQIQVLKTISEIRMRSYLLTPTHRCGTIWAALLKHFKGLWTPHSQFSTVRDSLHTSTETLRLPMESQAHDTNPAPWSGSLDFGTTGRSQARNSATVWNSSYGPCDLEWATSEHWTLTASPVT